MFHNLQACGKPQEAAGEVSALLALMRQNRAAVQNKAYTLTPQPCCLNPEP